MLSVLGENARKRVVQWSEKMRKTIISAVVFLVMSQSAVAQIYGGLDEHGNKQIRGQQPGQIFVQCLNDGAGDFLTYDLDFHLVIHSRKNGPTWMFSAQWRESGTANDSYGNSWDFNGHWKVNETSEDPDWTNRSHITVVENLLFVSHTGAPNLKYSFTREVRWRDGEEVVRDRDFSITCLKNAQGD